MDEVFNAIFVNLKHPDTKEIVKYPPGFQQKHLDSAVKYKAKANDVFVCSYPKCGSTWLQVVVWSIIHHGEHLRLKHIRDSIPELEFDGCEAVEEMAQRENPLIIKTHLPYAMVPKHPDAKYVYITRNVKDVMVSYYYFLKAYPQHYNCCDFTLNNLFARFVKGKIGFGSFFDHVLPWYENRHQSNLLFLTYEELKRDPRSNVLKIAQFLSDYYQKRLENDEKTLKKILEQISFKWMKNCPTEWVSL